MPDDELEAIEAAAMAPDEAWRGGAITSARHDILTLLAEVRRLRASNDALRVAADAFLYAGDISGPGAQSVYNEALAALLAALKDAQ